MYRPGYVCQSIRSSTWDIELWSLVQKCTRYRYQVLFLNASHTICNDTLHAKSISIKTEANVEKGIKSSTSYKVLLNRLLSLTHGNSLEIKINYRRWVQKSQGEFCSRELRKNGRELETFRCRAVGRSENPGAPVVIRWA